LFGEYIECFCYVGPHIQTVQKRAHIHTCCQLIMATMTEASQMLPQITTTKVSNIYITQTTRAIHHHHYHHHCCCWLSAHMPYLSTLTPD